MEKCSSYLITSQEYDKNYKLLARKGQNTVAGETLLAKKS